jgi:hypothetical protein
MNLISFSHANVTYIIVKVYSILNQVNGLVRSVTILNV